MATANCWIIGHFYGSIVPNFTVEAKRTNATRHITSHPTSARSATDAKESDRFCNNVTIHSVNLQYSLGFGGAQQAETEGKLVRLGMSSLVVVVAVAAVYDSTSTS